ncbi:unnamed protein product [Rotaria sordida]|uniref:Kinesin light chain n=1 Tax=Rotaria sordida TaxID=392033 RepID=A0A814GQZ8_9BILA|nr:unnamed protein product [Rotaria sordida]
MAYKFPIQSIASKLSVSTNDNENKENITLIWFDPNIGSHEDIEKIKQQLRLINDYVIFSTDFGHCIKLIQSIDKEKIFLITSGSEAKQILSRKSTCGQIDSVFIFCTNKTPHEHLLNEYERIIGIYVNLDDLYQSIKEQLNFIDKQIQAFSFFDPHEKLTEKLSKESAAFLWFQLFNYVINQLPRNQQAKQQMLHICKEYYRGNRKEIKLIEEFERMYRSKDAIRWYLKQSFVYKLINKALRTEDIDLLYIFQFFISDLSEVLQQEHKQILLSKEKILNVYRGVKFDKEEFKKLKENQGKLISTNGYLSTSRRKSLALHFAMKPTKRIDVVSVLFHIQCNIQQINQCITFADVSEFSEYPEEQEVLFDLNACFFIESIEEHELLTIIKMSLSTEGQKIKKDYLELIQKQTDKQSILIVFGRLLCDIGEYDKSLKYFRQLLNDPNNEDHAWIEFNMGRILAVKGELNEARKYYDRAYNRMMNYRPARIKDFAHIFNNIGVILYQQEKYDEALHYHQQALKMQELFYPSGHIDIVQSLNNIGNVFDIQRKYNQALTYHQRVLKIQEKFYSPDHVDIARSLSNMALIFSDQGNYDEALDYHQRVLKIQEKCYPSGHIDIASTLNNIGVCYEGQNNQDAALDYYQRSLTMHKNFLPVDHPNRQKTETNIRRLTGKE